MQGRWFTFWEHVRQEFARALLLVLFEKRDGTETGLAMRIRAGKSHVTQAHNHSAHNAVEASRAAAQTTKHWEK
jgi:hypothetical protein